MSEIQNYNDAVQTIKNAILLSQYDAAKSVNEKQLALYYSIGKYISENSREGVWGTGAIDAISERLQKELPGLRGFSARNLRNMRMFYEEWAREENDVLPDKDKLAVATAKTPGKTDKANWQLQLPNYVQCSEEAFTSIGFTQHILILTKVKERNERIFYIQRCADQKYNVDQLKRSIREDEYHHQGTLPNNFSQTISSDQRALRAINTFKDEYLLDFINVEELNVRDKEDIDERIVENAIIHNIKNFILTFGKDFTFIKNQYHLEAFGENQYIDLLFFNRALNCLVAVELKTGAFKTSYLGQLSGYLSVLDGYEKKPHENPSIGLVLCKDMNKSFVDYVIQDFSKPMGVATYKTSEDMPKELIQALPDIDDLRKLLDEEI